jgi:TRAP-type C4-dicarboxylate transport system permease small subunit
MRERYRAQLPPHPVFLRRLARTFLLAVFIIGGSLCLGVLGYHSIGGLPWVDALLNASMILGGMGPVDVLTTRSAKLFASAYALFSGVILLASVAVMIAPLVHRFLHRYHLELDEDDRGE